MQVNNYSTNSHNKKLGFGRIYVNELKEAMPELEKRYGGKKIDVYIREGTCKSQVIARKDGVVKKVVDTPQNFMQKLLKMKSEAMGLVLMPKRKLTRV